MAQPLSGVVAWRDAKQPSMFHEHGSEGFARDPLGGRESLLRGHELGRERIEVRRGRAPARTRRPSRARSVFPEILAH